MKKVWVNVLRSCQGSEREATGALCGPKRFSPGVQQIEESLAKVFVEDLKLAQPAKAPAENAGVGDGKGPSEPPPTDQKPADGGKKGEDRKGKDKKGAPENKAQG
jgi:hypothetical protein